MATGIVRWIRVWPPSGWHDEPWLGDADADAFCRSAVSVARVYSSGLPALQLSAWRSGVQLSCGLPSDDGRVHVLAQVDRIDHEVDVGGVRLPPGVAGWAPDDRARLVVEVLHAAMVRLGESRGWDPVLLEQLREETLARGLEHRGAGAWRTSPDRRHRARATFRTEADGQDRLRLEVVDRSGAQLAVTEEVHGWMDEKHRPVRWDGKDRVVLTTVPGVGRMREAHLSLERTGEGWTSTADDPNTGHLPIAGAGDPPGRALPEVVTTGCGLDAPEDPPGIRAGGGGPTTGVDATYLDEVDRLLRVFADDAGQAWWQDAGVKELRVTYHFGPEPGVRSRRTGQRLSAEIRRPAETTHGDAEQLAEADLRALVAEVRRKTGLGPHPEIRE